MRLLCLAGAQHMPPPGRACCSMSAYLVVVASKHERPSQPLTGASLTLQLASLSVLLPSAGSPDHTQEVRDPSAAGHQDANWGSHCSCSQGGTPRAASLQPVRPPWALLQIHAEGELTSSLSCQAPLYTPRSAAKRGACLSCGRATSMWHWPCRQSPQPASSPGSARWLHLCMTADCQAAALPAPAVPCT